MAVALLVVVAGGCSADPADGGDATTTQVVSSTTTGGRTQTTTPVDVDPAQEAAYVAEVAEGIVDPDAGGLPVTAEQARCLAPEWVRALGYRKLVEGGVSGRDLGRGNGADTSPALDRLIGRPQSRKMVAAFASCGVDIQPVFVAALAADSGLSADQRSCLVAKLPQDFVETVLETSLADGASALGDDPALAQQLRAAVAACA